MANATGKQMSALFKFVNRRFWIPDNKPQPTKDEATAMLSLCFRWKDAKEAGDRDAIAGAKGALTKMVRRWFPEWDSSELEDKIRRKKSKFDYEKQHRNDGSGIKRNRHNDDDDKDKNHEIQETDREGGGGDEGGNDKTGGSGDNGDGSIGEDQGDGGQGKDGSGNGNDSSGDKSKQGDTGSGDSGDREPADPTCPECDGKGGDNGEPCSGCGGEAPAEAYDDCSKCGGEGGENGEPCDECGGRQPSKSKESHDENTGDENEKSDGDGEGGEDQQEGDGEGGEDQQEGDGEGGEDQQEQEQEQEEQKQQEDDLDPTIRKTAEKIKAGLRNFYWFGPAGTGKTTLTKILGHVLTTSEFLGHKWPVTVLSCNAGTSPSEIRGFYFPEPRPSIVMSALAVPGIIVFDEFTTLDPSVAAVANALLANGEVETSMGNVRRHPDCVIIVTSNTLGTGADREYIGNNQLDSATLDRFIGGKFHVNYSEKYESKYDKQVVEWIYLLRRVVKENGFRRVVSTRAIQACTALKKANVEWKHEPIFDWTPEERGTIPGWGDASEAKFFGDRK